MKRLLIPSAALLWGLQFAFLNPALALLLVALYDASPGQVGTALAIYNASGFLASLLVPAYADRRGDYLRPMLACAILTLALAGALTLSTSLPVALIALVVLGGPAGVGNSLLFAHLKHSGASASQVVNTRALVSFAWVAGPPLATLIMGAFGERTILPVLAAVALLTITTVVVMLTRRSPIPDAGQTTGPSESEVGSSRWGVAAILVAFVLLQATNSAAVSIMSLFVTRDVGLDVLWAGIALGVAAGLEIPALLLVGRLVSRFSHLTLLGTGCLAGIGYYAAMTQVEGPLTLLAAQVLNAWFFAAIAGVGLTLFQQVIARPGLASGLYTNTRRLGAIVSGPLIAFGASSSMGYAGVFAACAALTALGLIVLLWAGRIRKPRSSVSSTGQRAG